MDVALIIGLYLTIDPLMDTTKKTQSTSIGSFSLITIDSVVVVSGSTTYSSLYVCDCVCAALFVVSFLLACFKSEA